MVKPESLVRMSKTQQRRGLQPDPASHGVTPGATPRVPPSPLTPAELQAVSPSPSVGMVQAGAVRAAALARAGSGAVGAGAGPVVFGPGGRVKTQAGAARNVDPLPPSKPPKSPLTITVTIPLRTARGQNNREHPMARHKRVRKEHLMVAWSLAHAFGQQRPPIPALCRLTRLAPSDGLDDDNLSGSMKSVRDAIAKWLGVDDKHRDIVRYEYAQQRSNRAYHVRIEFLPMPSNLEQTP